MKHFNQIILSASLLLIAFSSAAQQYSKVTYVHSDPDGTAFVATNEAGDLEWQIEHYPFGDEYENTQTERNSDIGFTGKPFDEEIGLSYMGGRWYDPDIGRFTGIDPMPVQFEDYESFNRYAYAKNNPYKYVDPDGNFVFLAPLAIFVAKEIAAEVASRATGGATDFLSTRRLATKIIEGGVKLFRRKAATPSSVTGTGGTSGAARRCCFVAGTQVLTASGYKNIEEVELGEKLWAKDVDTGAQDWKPVIKIFEEPDRGIYKISLIAEDGFEQIIQATDDHPFYTVGGGWKTTIELSEGDLIETDGNAPMKVASVVDESRTDLTYNFTVADFHTYYVTKRNVLVHNCGGTVKDKIKVADFSHQCAGLI